MNILQASGVESTISALDMLLPPPPAPPPKPVAAVERPKPAAAPLDQMLPSSSGRTAPPPAARSSNQKFDFAAVMGFSGLAPELINSRAASEWPCFHICRGALPE